MEQVCINSIYIQHVIYTINFIHTCHTKPCSHTEHTCVSCVFAHAHIAYSMCTCIIQHMYLLVHPIMVGSLPYENDLIDGIEDDNIRDSTMIYR